jgi:hypothetical protein
MGLSPSSHGLFPRGAIELVEFFHEKCHAEWEAELAAVDKQVSTRRPPPTAHGLAPDMPPAV